MRALGLNTVLVPAYWELMEYYFLFSQRMLHKGQFWTSYFGILVSGRKSINI